MTKPAAFAFAFLTLAACTSGPFSNVTQPISIVDLSKPLKDSTYLRFLPSRSQVLVVAIERGKSARVLHYDMSGTQKSEFPVPGYADFPLLQDIESDAGGDLLLLKAGRDGARAEVVDSDGRVLHEYPLKPGARRIAAASQQLFVISDAGIVRAEDGSLLTTLPKDEYHFAGVGSNKLVAVSATLPTMYTYDLVTKTKSAYGLNAPELVAAIQWSQKQAATSPRLIIFGLTVDAQGLIYAAVNPLTADLKIFKFDDTGHVKGHLVLRLPDAPGESVTNHMDASGGVSVLGDRLLVASRRKRKLAFYPNLPEGATNALVP